MLVIAPDTDNMDSYNADHAQWLNKYASYLIAHQVANLELEEHPEEFGGIFLLTRDDPDIVEYTHKWIIPGNLKHYFEAEPLRLILVRLYRFDYANDVILAFQEKDAILVYHLTLTGIPVVHP